MKNNSEYQAKRFKLIETTPEKYHNLAEKDPHTLYFLSNGQLFKGDVIYSGNIHIIDNSSIPMQGDDNAIYINTDTREILVWRNNKFESSIPRVAERIPVTETMAIENPEVNGMLVTTKAVKDYITKLVELGTIAGGYDGPMANVPTSVVRTTKNIISIDQNIGKYKAGDIIPRGTSLEDILQNMFTRVIDVVYRKPSIKISPTIIRVEAGTYMKHNFKIQYDSGDGGTVESMLFLKGLNNSYGDPIFFSKYTVKEWTTPEPVMITDSDLLQYKAVVKYTDGEIKHNNIGEAQDTGRIKAGVVEDVCQLIGERFVWYQSSGLANIPFDKSSEVRGMANKILGAKKDSEFMIEVARGDAQVVIAYPKIYGPITSVKSRIGSVELKDQFKPSITLVEGANGYRSIEYYVYKYTPVTPFVSNDIFDVII
jgi:hypothetical protein